MLDLLPVEILYRIFDYLDVETLVFSVRKVSTKFYQMTTFYNRYDFDFSSISKMAIRFILQLIPFENVIRLTLSDEDRTRGAIQYFLSSCDLQRFSRLRSLKILQLESTLLQQFLDFIRQSQLISFHIEMLTIRPHRSNDFSVIFQHETIRNLQLNLSTSIVPSLNNVILNSLRIIDSISFDKLVEILKTFTQLRRLIVKEISNSNSDMFDHRFDFCSSLTSFTVEGIRDDGENLSACFNLMPLLTHLTVIGSGSISNSIFDGNHWETLIQEKLVHLKLFQFFFSISIDRNRRLLTMKSFIEPFQSVFWIENFPTAVQCDEVFKTVRFLLYTFPLCQSNFTYRCDSKKCSIRNRIAEKMLNDMSNVTQLELELPDRKIDEPNDQVRLFFGSERNKKFNKFSSLKILKVNGFFFNSVTSLNLPDHRRSSFIPIKLLSKLVDLSKLTKLSLALKFYPNEFPDLQENLREFFQLTTNLRSLSLFDYWSPSHFSSRLTILFSILPEYLRHLQIRVRDLDDIRNILKHLKQLNSVTFEYSSMLTIQSDELLNCLTDVGRSTSSWNSTNAIHLWLGPLNKTND